MLSIRAHVDELKPIMALNGFIYSENYRGQRIPEQLVDVFPGVLNKPKLVGQIDLDTVYCKDQQIPSFESIEGSEQFVDVWSGRNEIQKGFPDIFVSSKNKRLTQVRVNNAFSGDIRQSYALQMFRGDKSILGWCWTDKSRGLDVTGDGL